MLSASLMCGYGPPGTGLPKTYIMAPIHMWIEIQVGCLLVALPVNAHIDLHTPDVAFLCSSSRDQSIYPSHFYFENIMRKNLGR